LTVSTNRLKQRRLGQPKLRNKFRQLCPLRVKRYRWIPRQCRHLSPDVTELALDAGNPKVPKLPKEALQTRTDFGAPGYGGPCPPLGDHPHRYLFTVFAVGVDSLPVTADTSAAIIGFQLNFNTLAKAAIMGLYKR